MKRGDDARPKRLDPVRITTALGDGIEQLPGEHVMRRALEARLEMRLDIQRFHLIDFGVEIVPQTAHSCLAINQGRGAD